MKPWGTPTFEKLTEEELAKEGTRPEEWKENERV